MYVKRVVQDRLQNCEGLEVCRQSQTLDIFRRLMLDIVFGTGGSRFTDLRSDGSQSVFPCCWNGFVLQSLAESPMHGQDIKYVGNILKKCFVARRST